MEFFGFTFIMFTGAVIALVGLLALVMAAFTTSAAWGLASLVIPPLALVFAVTHWSKGRNGFAILMIGVIVFSYGAWDKTRNEQAEAERMAAQQEATVDVTPVPEPEAPDTAGESAATVPPPATTPADPAKTAPITSSPAQAKIINIIDINKHIGSRIRVTTANGAVRTGVLQEVHSDKIIIDFKPRGVETVIRADIKENEIELIELLPEE